jgi:hypothetical protein
MTWCKCAKWLQKPAPAQDSVVQAVTPCAKSRQVVIDRVGVHRGRLVAACAAEATKQYSLPDASRWVRHLNPKP